ncbi:Hypp6458 [Branchiostoma lanceolatum]|uniref:Hypp6458 protein n=1 Tax=Branchiostoma lanceolatum TaxID=7740 RepID=A0A8J9YUS0_BRALA|nr:Hypp6458 [Branchiostoma lanceolatum]
MGVFDKAASAFFTVVHTLSLLRPGGKRWTGEPKLNVTVHEGKVGRHSQGKYVVTLRHGKEKQQTKKKKSDGLVWEHAAVFSHWTPTDPLILKLRKAKRCKDATIAELPIDVAAALASVDGLPNRWWYAIERIDKAGRQKEEVFLQITITVDGSGVKSGSTQAPAKPAREAATKAGQETKRSTQDNSPQSAADDTAVVKASDKTAHGEEDVEGHSRDKGEEVPHVSSTVDGHTGDNDSGRGQDSTRPSENTVMTAGQENQKYTAEETEVPTVSTDVEVEQAPATEVDSGRSQDPAKPTNETAAQDKPSTKRGVEPSHGRRSSVSQEGETGTSDSSSRRTDATPPSAAGDITDVKSEQPSSTSLTPSPPASCDTPDQAGTSGRGEGDFKADTEHHSRDKDVEVPQLSSAVDGHTGDNDSGRGQAAKSNDDETDTDGAGETASSTRGGGAALPSTDTAPRQADADDPQYEEMMSSIDDLWDDLITKREYADELQTYADSLRSKLAATAPHVLNYTVIKNLAAQVPVCKSYDLPQTEGLSLWHLKDIQNTLAKLLKDEEERATYLRKWYIDEMCKVALKEAPQVLGAQD